MRRVRRVIRWVVYGTMLVLAIMTGAYYLVAHTDPGVERVSRSILDRVQGSLQGQLHVADITSHGLLSGVTVHGVSLETGDGRPFARADSIHLGYALLQLIRGRIVFDDIRIHGADVVLERLPGSDTWNYDRLLRTGDGGGDRRFIALDGVELDSAVVVVRMPWDGSAAAADSERVVVEQAPGGLVRTLRFDVGRADLPRVVISSPETPGRLIIVRHLAVSARVLETPLEVRDLDGSVEIRDSLVSFTARRVELPASRTAARGRIITTLPRNYDIQFVAADVALADLRWLFPQLPDEGRGTADVTLRTVDRTDLLVDIRNLDARTGASRIRGTFGMVTGAPLRLRNVELDAQPLEVALLERVAGRPLPVAGRLQGRFTADGPLASLRTTGDMRLSRPGGSGTRVDVRWTGTAGLGQHLAARDLEVELRRLELGLVAAQVPALALRGTVNGQARLDGTLSSGLRVRGSLRHTAAAGTQSRATVQGTVTAGEGTPSVDLRLTAEPVSLRTVAVQYPGLERFDGDVQGTVTARGPLDDLGIDADLDTPAGAVAFNGRLDRTGDVARYTARGELRSFHLDEVMPGLPRTLLTTRFEVDGQGLDAASLNGRFALDVDHARVREFDVRAARVRLTLGDGRVHVDTLTAESDMGRLAAHGDFGLDAADPGTAEVELAADSLAALESLFFPDTALIVDPDAAPMEFGGAVAVRARLEGSIDGFDAEGTLQLHGGRYQGATVDTAAVRFRATGLRTDSTAVQGSVDASSVRYGDRTASRITLDGRYALDGRARFNVHVQTPGDEGLAAAGGFVLAGGNADVELDSLELRVGRQSWLLQDTVTGRVGADGLRVDRLVLTRSGGGRILLDGQLPWREQLAGEAIRAQADFTAEADGFRITEFLRLAQADTTLGGVAAGRVRVTGTAGSPVIDGRLVVDSFRFHAARLDSLATDLSYRDRTVDGQVHGWHSDTRILDGEATVPVDLALGTVETRRLDRPLSAQLRSSDVPAALALALVTGFRDVEGRVNGTLELHGTTLEPTLGGSISLEEGAATFDPLGVRYRRIQARFDVVEPTVVSVGGRLETESGGADVDGRITFDPVSDPTFALAVTARRLQAARRRDFRSLASGDVRLSGHYTRPVVTGNLQLSQGELNIDEIQRRSQIVQLESPFLMEVIDTSQVSVGQVLPTTTSPFLQNIQVNDLALDIGADVWLRSRQLNVALSGALSVNFDRQSQDLIAMTGVLQALRGTYVLQPGAQRYAVVSEPLQRRFQIQSGTIEFVGTPGIDPNLDVSASHRVNVAGRSADALNITANVTGTLLNPRVTLSSDAQPAISETDLLSYLYFGQPSFQLGQNQAELLTSVGANLLGSGLQNVFSNAGIFDYFGISAPTLGGQTLQASNPQPLYVGTLVEAGRYLGRDVFLAGSLRLPNFRDQGVSQLPNQIGLRLEWQFMPTWTAETFWESRFLRQPAFGLGLLNEEPPVFGLSLFREWSY